MELIYSTLKFLFTFSDFFFLHFSKLAFYLISIKKEKKFQTLLNTLLSFSFFFSTHCFVPIVKHADYLPQIQKVKTFILSICNLCNGISIFALGLFKKTILADTAGINADGIFELVSKGIAPNMIESWIALLSYSFQIYFDFSGYSDMAIGLARMFNIHLPINFFSLYKATSIIEFWRRWHISLSDFLYVLKKSWHRFARHDFSRKFF